MGYALHSTDGRAAAMEQRSSWFARFSAVVGLVGGLAGALGAGLVLWDRYFPPSVEPLKLIPVVGRSSGSPSAQYWSSTTAAGDSNDAWVVLFSVGDVFNSRKNLSDITVRAVRGGSSGPRVHAS